MNTVTVKSIREAIWWLFTAVLVAIVLLPILLQVDYRFTVVNAILLVIIITYGRWFIFFRNMLHFRITWVKLLFVIGNLFLALWLVGTIQDLMVRIDTNFLYDFAWQSHEPMSLDEEYSILRYIRSELLFCIVASVVTILLLQVRLFLSFFNRKGAKLKHLYESGSSGN